MEDVKEGDEGNDATSAGVLVQQELGVLFDEQRYWWGKNEEKNIRGIKARRQHGLEKTAIGARGKFK